MTRLPWAVAVVLGLALGTALRGSDGEPRPLGEIVVRGTREESGLTGAQGRTWEWIEREAIRQSGATSLGEALERLSGATVSERGGWPVQADVAIRGGSFQQTLLALDGLPLSDPQTAHHDFNVPFLLRDLRGVAVIYGAHSGVYGPGAYAGVLNLLPRVPTHSGAWMEAAAGAFSTRRAAAGADWVGRSERLSASGSYSTSDGFRPGTDYEIWSAWGSAVWEKDRASIRASGGRVEKDFGAADFYAPYPSREDTAATLVDLAPAWDLGEGWLLRAQARWRRHEDTFVLTAEDPDRYRGEHISDAFTERVSVRFSGDRALRVEAGIERSDVRLESSSLGRRKAWDHAGFVAGRVQAGEGWELDGSLRVDDHRLWGTAWAPSASLVRRWGERLAARAALARGLRPPSFTELYYRDPLHTANEHLEPETAWSAEAGMEADAGPVRVSVTAFHQDGRQVIDWVRRRPEDPWESANMGRLTVQGGEIRSQVQAKMDPCRLQCGMLYRYTDEDAAPLGLESKYALRIARHEAGGTVSTTARRLEVGADARYATGPAVDARWLVCGRVAYRLWNFATLFLTGRNLLDQRYEDIPGLPAPPRSWEAGVEMTW